LLMQRVWSIWIRWAATTSVNYYDAMRPRLLLGQGLNMSSKRKQEDVDRKKYWNEDYVRYWKSRVEEANESKGNASHMVEGDVKTTTDDLYLNAIDLLKITKSDHVLEIGCGFGRSLNTLCGVALHVTATDISEQMIVAAKQACQESNIAFHVSPSEDLPFPDESFDVVVCFAAFDAMYQAEALIEMNRVCRPGARVLITGKNDNYHDDDTPAMAAEIGAREKNHPNYFTDVVKLVRNINEFGFGIETQRYYQRRGDFANETAYTEMPERFYEYLLVLRKTDGCHATGDFRISEKISKTHCRQGAVS